jgi:hypothetical protein
VPIGNGDMLIQATQSCSTMVGSTVLRYKNIHRATWCWSADRLSWNKIGYMLIGTWHVDFVECRNMQMSKHWFWSLFGNSKIKNMYIGHKKGLKVNARKNVIHLNGRLRRLIASVTRSVSVSARYTLFSWVGYEWWMGKVWRSNYASSRWDSTTIENCNNF